MENLIKLLEEEKIIKNSNYYSINTVTKQGSENLVNDIENIIEDLMITNPKFKTIDNIEIDPEFIQEEEDPFLERLLTTQILPWYYSILYKKTASLIIWLKV